MSKGRVVAWVVLAVAFAVAAAAFGYGLAKQDEQTQPPATLSGTITTAPPPDCTQTAPDGGSPTVADLGKPCMLDGQVRTFIPASQRCTDGTVLMWNDLGRGVDGVTFTWWPPDHSGAKAPSMAELAACSGQP